MENSSADRFVLETPENIRFGYDVADIGSRFLAIFIDSVIQGTMYVVLVLGIVLLLARISTTSLPGYAYNILTGAFFLVLFLIQFGYFLFFEIIFNGQTPGKRLFNLRVIKENGAPLSPLDTIIRNLVRVIDFFPIMYGIGILVMFFNGRAKRLGDYAAGTIVVNMRNQVRLQDLQTTPPTSPKTNAPLGIGRLTETEIGLAESFLQRRHGLANSSELAIEIAQRFAKKMELGDGAVPSSADAATRFIQETVNTYRSRNI